MQTSFTARQKDFSNFSQRSGARHFSKCQVLPEAELALWLLFWWELLADVYIFRSVLQ